MADLFTLGELASYLQQDLDASTAANVRRVASGWLKSATALTDWPSPIPDDLWGWGLELAGIAYRNPDAAASEGVDDYTVTWDRFRRADILKAARGIYGTAGKPQYSFPEWDWHWQVVPVQD